MAISSYNAKLMKGTTSGDTTTWAELLAVKKTPQLGGAPEQLETTTLDDNMQTYINGIQSSEAMEFTANYDSDDYDTLKALEGETNPYAIWFGNDGNGSEGKYKFDGQLSVFINEAEVNAVVCNLLEYLTQRDIQTKNSGVNVRYRGKHRFFKGFNEFIKEKTRRCDNDFEKIERHVFF